MSNRTRKRLSQEEKRGIVLLSELTIMKKTKIADLFGVTRSRVSQICNDYYGELTELGVKRISDESE